MNVVKTAIPDVLIIEPKVFGDERGFFMESYNRRALAQATAKRLHARSLRTFCPLRSVLARLSRADPPDQVEGIDQK